MVDVGGERHNTEAHETPMAFFVKSHRFDLIKQYQVCSPVNATRGKFEVSCMLEIDGSDELGKNTTNPGYWRHPSPPVKAVWLRIRTYQNGEAPGALSEQAKLDHRETHGCFQEEDFWQHIYANPRSNQS